MFFSRRSFYPYLFLTGNTFTSAAHCLDYMLCASDGNSYRITYKVSQIDTLGKTETIPRNKCELLPSLLG